MAVSCLHHVFSHLVIDGGPKHYKKEAESDHRQDTKEGGQEDGQPHVGLVQRVSSCTYRPKKK